MFLCFLFSFLEILDSILTCSDGGGYRADNKQCQDNNTPNPLAAILFHQPKEEGDEGYGENHNKKPACTCHAGKGRKKTVGMQMDLQLTESLTKYFEKTVAVSDDILLYLAP